MTKENMGGKTWRGKMEEEMTDQGFGYREGVKMD